MAVALVLRAFGFLWQVLVLRPSGSADCPSLADAGRLGSGMALRRASPSVPPAGEAPRPPARRAGIPRASARPGWQCRQR